MSVHEWLSVMFIVAGTAGTAGSVAYMARTSTIRSNQNSRDISELRERVAALEAVIGIPKQHRE